MPARPEQAPRQLRHPAAGTQYPDIPRQWSGPAYEWLPPQWNDLPPAGLDAPMPVPPAHTIRNILLGITGLVGAFVFLVVGGLALTTGSSATIGAWRDGGGLDHLTALSKDLAAAEHASEAADLAGVSRACLSLQSDTEAAQAYAPIPDAEAQTHWAAALTHLAQASTNCVTAVRYRDSALFIQASDELGAVPADVSHVINRLTALNR